MSDKFDKVEKVPRFVTRLKTLNSVVGSQSFEYELPSTPDSDYVVDDSRFTPISEAIKQLRNVTISSAEIETCFDFPNGVDNGMRIPATRKAGYADITELTTSIMADVTAQAEELSRAKQLKALHDNQKKAEVDFKQKLSGSSQ